MFHRPMLALLPGLALLASAHTALAQDLYVSADRTVANGNPINGTFDTVRIGKDSTLADYNGVHADVTGGTYNNNFFAFNTSTVNITGGLFNKAILPQNASVMNFGGTAQATTFLAIFNTGTLNVTGGTINSLQCSNTSTTNVTGGVIQNGRTLDAGKLNVTGGAFTVGLDAFANSTITLSAGTVANSLSAHDNSIVNFGGTTQADFTQSADFSTLNITGNAVSNGLDATDDSVVNISGGTVHSLLEADSFSTVNFGGTAHADAIYAGDNSTVNITGGVMTDLLGGGGTYNISGGQIANNTLANIGEGLGFSPSLYNLIGTNLTLGNAMSGIFDDGFGDVLDGVFWDLKGTLQNGDALNTRYFEEGGSLSTPEHITGAQVIAATPEPGSVGLLLGAAVPASLWAKSFRRRRRRLG